MWSVILEFHGINTKYVIHAYPEIFNYWNKLKYTKSDDLSSSSGIKLSHEDRDQK